MLVQELFSACHSFIIESHSPHHQVPVTKSIIKHQSTSTSFFKWPFFSSVHIFSVQIGVLQQKIWSNAPHIIGSFTIAMIALKVLLPCWLLCKTRSFQACQTPLLSCFENLKFIYQWLSRASWSSSTKLWEYRICSAKPGTSHFDLFRSRLGRLEARLNIQQLQAMYQVSFLYRIRLYVFYCRYTCCFNQLLGQFGFKLLRQGQERHPGRVRECLPSSVQNPSIYRIVEFL